MLVDVTQKLQMNIVPVNNPQAKNKYGEQQGFYRAYVSHDYHALIQGQQEIHRGIVPSNIGYGTHSTPRIAALNALDDYADKFGDLCIHDTDDEFGDKLPIHKKD